MSRLSKAQLNKFREDVKDRIFNTLTELSLYLHEFNEGVDRTNKRAKDFEKELGTRPRHSTASAFDVERAIFLIHGTSTRQAITAIVLQRLISQLEDMFMLINARLDSKRDGVETKMTRLEKEVKILRKGRRNSKLHIPSKYKKVLDDAIARDAQRQKAGQGYIK